MSMLLLTNTRITMIFKLKVTSKVDCLRSVASGHFVSTIQSAPFSTSSPRLSMETNYK